MNACFQGNRVVTETSTNLRNTKTDKVFRRIRQMIIDLEFRPGAVIQKEQLTSLFGVSRAPINEALARLREEDLVYIAPQHGTFVQAIHISKLKEGLFFRRAVEPKAIAALALSATQTLIDQLEDNLQRQRSAVRGGDLSALHNLDDAFHSLLLQKGDLQHTVRLVRTFSAHLERARNLAHVTRRRPNDTVEDHAQIVAALAARDPRWAESAMDLHLASALAPLRKMIEETPELFTAGEDHAATINQQSRASA
jgi:DNA-binding GntR family transcriptional regulator